MRKLPSCFFEMLLTRLLCFSAAICPAPSLLLLVAYYLLFGWTVIAVRMNCFTCSPACNSSKSFLHVCKRIVLYFPMVIVIQRYFFWRPQQLRSGRFSICVILQLLLRNDSKKIDFCREVFTILAKRILFGKSTIPQNVDLLNLLVIWYFWMIWP